MAKLLWPGLTCPARAVPYEDSSLWARMLGFWPLGNSCALGGHRHHAGMDHAQNWLLHFF
jgi:hypothetical protein